MRLPKSNPDKYTSTLVAKTPNLLVPHFLIHSFLYYVCDWSIISDDTFDRVLVEGLRKRWDSVEHRHKHLIDPSLLKSGFYLRYPRITASSAISLADHFQPGCRRLEECQEALIPQEQDNKPS